MGKEQFQELIKNQMYYDTHARDECTQTSDHKYMNVELSWVPSCKEKHCSLPLIDYYMLASC